MFHDLQGARFGRQIVSAALARFYRSDDSGATEVDLALFHEILRLRLRRPVPPTASQEGSFLISLDHVARGKRGSRAAGPTPPHGGRFCPCSMDRFRACRAKNGVSVHRLAKEPHMTSYPQAPADRQDANSHELRFDSLFHPGRGVVVPCDAAGHVDLDVLSERLRNAYLGARAMVGREYAYPTVQRVH